MDKLDVTPDTKLDRIDAGVVELEVMAEVGDVVDAIAEYVTDNNWSSDAEKNDMI